MKRHQIEKRNQTEKHEKNSTQFIYTLLPWESYTRLKIYTILYSYEFCVFIAIDFLFSG